MSNNEVNLFVSLYAFHRVGCLRDYVAMGMIYHMNVQIFLVALARRVFPCEDCPPVFISTHSLAVGNGILDCLNAC